SMQLIYVETLDGFGVTSIYPSTEAYQVMYSFTMPYDRKIADLELPIAMDTAASIVMVPEDGIRLRSEQLQESGARDMQGVSYNIFNSAALQAGDYLRLSLSGQPKSGTELVTALGDEGHLGLVIGLAVFGLALIGVGVYLWRRSRFTEDEYAELEQDLDDATEMALDPAVLMDEIIVLDDLYQAGELPEDAYQQRRAELKARLEQVMGAE
ncbi:MAG: hypothetical protein JW862_03030, partial [Anaerolineales bacterium]|nr:hypothetical protein [Anaerolineales bacterium]